MYKDSELNIVFVLSYMLICLVSLPFIIIWVSSRALTCLSILSMFGFSFWLIIFNYIQTRKYTISTNNFIENIKDMLKYRSDYTDTKVLNDIEVKIIRYLGDRHHYQYFSTAKCILLEDTEFAFSENGHILDGSSEYILQAKSTLIIPDTAIFEIISHNKKRKVIIRSSNSTSRFFGIGEYKKSQNGKIKIMENDLISIKPGARVIFTGKFYYEEIIDGTIVRNAKDHFQSYYTYKNYEAILC